MKRNKEMGGVEVVLTRVVDHPNEVASGSGWVGEDQIDTPGLQVIVTRSIHADDEACPGHATSRGSA